MAGWLEAGEGQCLLGPFPGLRSPDPETRLSPPSAGQGQPTNQEIYTAFLPSAGHARAGGRPQSAEEAMAPLPGQLHKEAGPGGLREIP